MPNHNLKEIDKFALSRLKNENEKLFRNCPKMVRKKTVTLKELQYLQNAIDIFNEVRSLHKNKPSNVSPDNKACRQLVEMCRDGIDFNEIESACYNMFGSDYHKENNWTHLTPEFISRSDKFQKYLD